MKITIYEPKELGEKGLCVRLVALEEGYGVRLVAVDPETGRPVDSGNLLTLSAHGLRRHHEVSDLLGLPLDSLGRIELLDD